MSERRVVLITGARKGIGRYLAERYAAQGCEVIGCSRSESDFEHDQYRHCCANVCDESAVRSLIRTVRKQHGRLDAVINNAGIASMNHSMVTPVNSFRSMLETNTVGTFLLCREAAKLMAKQKSGRIVNFTTVAVPLKLEGEAAYVASKAAVQSLTEVLAVELADFGITVNAVGPTPVETDLIRSVPSEKIDALLKRQAIQRMGTPEDVANVVDFFIDEASSFITGQTIYLGGVS